MRPVHVAILHPAAASDAGPLTRLTAAARASLVSPADGAAAARGGFAVAGTGHHQAKAR